MKTLEVTALLQPTPWKPKQLHYFIPLLVSILETVYYTIITNFYPLVGSRGILWYICSELLLVSNTPNIRQLTYKQGQLSINHKP